jgi:hypothetical protein
MPDPEDLTPNNEFLPKGVTGIGEPIDFVVA